MNRSLHRKYLNPRTLTGGQFSYVYRRCAPAAMTGPPTLGMSAKLAEKEGILFGSAPDFWNLDTNGEPIDKNGGMTQEELDEFYEEELEKEKEAKKEKRRKKKPTTNQVRGVLKKIIAYHIQKTREAHSSMYPPVKDLVKHNSSGDGGSRKRKESDYNRPIPTHDHTRKNKKRKKK